VIFRTFCNRSLILNPALYKAQLGALRGVSVKVVPASAPLSESFDEKNARLNRPQSPHLTIYKPQLTSMLSITHRGTGCALAAYAAIFGFAAIGCPDGANSIVTTLEAMQLGTLSLATLKFTLAFPFAFHAVNGVRHLFWDAGKFLSVKDVYSTGYAMLAVSTVLAIALTFM
jgi:succinate dehydrogenase (ubiquinone) cytochrome b560 subunit